MRKFSIFCLSAFLMLGGCLVSCDETEPSVVSTNNSAKVREGDVCIDLVITQMPKKLEYKSGERFSPLGLKFDAVYQNGFDGDKGLEAGDLDGWTPSGPLTSNDKTVKLKFEGFEKEITISVEEKELLGVEITRVPDVKSYSFGDLLNLTGLVVRATYEEGVDENEQNYVVKDNKGKVYVNGTILDEANPELELFVSVTSKGKTYSDSFKIGVYSGLSVQAEDIIKDGNFPTDKSYTTVNEDYSGYYESKDDCNFTGTGYIGTIGKNLELNFYIYSNVEIKNARLVLIASSTCQGNGRMEDMKFNDCFSAFIGEDNTKLNVDDSVVIPGLEYPAEGMGSKWTNWADAEFGTINLVKGFNKVRIVCVNTILDASNYGRTPNVDRLDIRF